jgi:hypothetical protein
LGQFERPLGRNRTGGEQQLGQLGSLVTRLAKQLFGSYPTAAATDAETGTSASSIGASGQTVPE